MTIKQGKLTKPEHLALLRQAIAANLAARVDHDRRRQEANRDKPVQFTLIPIGDLMGADDRRLYLEGVIDDPIRKALRKQLKDLGQRLFDALGTTEGMVEIAEEIADLKPGPWGYRIDIIDKAWDGVGAGGDRWWA
jgi:hypothetical protein